MHRYLSQCIWRIDHQNSIAITFDDGPHPEITPWVLSELRKYKIKACFFLVGDNVKKYPDIVRQILDEGHQIGGHTTHHLNLLKTNLKNYIEDTIGTQKMLETNYFRPPYGKITKQSFKKLLEQDSQIKVILWTLLSCDFDTKLSPEDSLKITIENLNLGDIVVFHDSEKAWPRLNYVLPRFLDFISKQNIQTKLIDE